jgi:8-oxo-dGTP diphosphatase
MTTMEIRLAGCVLTDEDDRVLLLHRNTSELTQWELPGGKVEPGESPEVAAVREVYEELGVRVETLKFLGETSFRQSETDWHYSWFRGSTSSGVRPDIREPQLHDTFEYVPLGRFGIGKKYELSPNVAALAKCIQDGEVQL